MKIFLLLLLIFVLILPWSSLIISLPTVLKNNPQNLHILADSPLDINGNAQLAAQASSGNGQPATPYIIKDKIITASVTNGIYIRNTNAYFTLKNCTVTNTNMAYVGIRLSNVTHARIENITANNNSAGIYLESSDSNTLIGNTANNNTDGIDLLDSNHNTLTSNNASANLHDGMAVSWSDSNKLTSNNASANLYDGILVTYSGNNTLTSNIAISNLHDGILVSYSVNNNTLTGNIAISNYNGIYFYQSDTNTVTGNTAHGNDYVGIFLDLSDMNTLTGNIACDNLYGISIWACHNNTLTGNTANSNTHGFTVGFGNNNTLTGNTANSNTGDGIYLRHSNYTRVIGNTLHGNSECIVEEVCVGNSKINNDCGNGNEIPGFTWALVLVVVSGLSLLAMAMKRKEKLLNFALS